MQEKLSYEDALKALHSGLTFDDSEVLQIGSFKDFTQNIWSLSYDMPEYFNAWHVGYICERVEEAFNNGKHFVAVLPRGHFKSTILGHAFMMWRLFKRKADYTSFLYMSYNIDMARYHTKDIKIRLARNPIISKQIARDLAPQATSTLAYMLRDGRRIEAITGGLRSFKRGMHVDGGMVADDVLKDPQNPLTPGELPQIAQHFESETMPIPNPGAPIVVVGTPMAPGDLLAKLMEDERFDHVFLPAVDPTPDRWILFPERFSWEVEKGKISLKAVRDGNRVSYSSEYMLTPHFGSDGYLSDQEVTQCEDRFTEADYKHQKNGVDKDYDFVVAGYDVGKRRHPAHLAIYGYQKTVKPEYEEFDLNRLEKIMADGVDVYDRRLIQLHQEFIDGWTYDAQANYLNDIAEKYEITRGYIDSTRGELEDRDLSRQWENMTFSTKTKTLMAAKFDHYVVSNKLYMIPNARQHEQILLVTKDLEAIETPGGHGDSFWSNAMACLAASELEDQESEFKMIGSIGSVFEDPQDTEETGLERFENPEMYNITYEDREPCPSCGHQGPGYIPERPICILCGYRG